MIKLSNLQKINAQYQKTLKKVAHRSNRFPIKERFIV